MLHVPAQRFETAVPDVVRPSSGASTGLALDAALRAAAQRLRDRSSTLEGEFVRIGQPLYEAVQSLIGLSAAFDDLTRELDHAEVVEATRELDHIVGQAHAASESLVAERAVLQRLIAAAAGMRSCTDHMHESVEVIGLISTYVRIAAAEVTSDETRFHEFTDELGRLRSAAAAAVDCFADHSAKLGELINTTSARHADAERAQDGALAMLRARLAGSLDAVSRQRQHAAAVAHGIEDRSGQIRHGIENVIGSLQVGDMLRQRLEHVDGALCSVADALVADQPGCDAGSDLLAAIPSEGRSTLAALACRLQACQLERSADTLDDEARRIISSLAMLIDEAAAIQRLGSELYKDSSRSGASFLSAIVADLGEMMSLLKSCEAARSGFNETITVTMEILDVLKTQFEAVRSIEVDVRIAALNATLRSERLGQAGKPLAVLAQELRSHGNMIVGYARDIMAGLSEISSAAEDLARTRGASEHTTMKSIEQVVQAATARLGQAGERMDSRLAELEQGAAFATSRLRHAASLVTIQDAVPPVLREIARRLAQISDEQHVDAMLEEEARAALHSALFGLYTMESERVAHVEILGPAGLSLSRGDIQTAVDGADQEEAAIDDIFF